MEPCTLTVAISVWSTVKMLFFGPLLTNSGILPPVIWVFVSNRKVSYGCVFTCWNFYSFCFQICMDLSTAFLSFNLWNRFGVCKRTAYTVFATHKVFIPTKSFWRRLFHPVSFVDYVLLLLVSKSSLVISFSMFLFDQTWVTLAGMDGFEVFSKSISTVLFFKGKRMSITFSNRGLYLVILGRAWFGLMGRQYTRTRRHMRRFFKQWSSIRVDCKDIDE